MSPAATSGCADSSRRCRKPYALQRVPSACQGDRVGAVENISATGCIDDRNLKAWLVLTVGSRRIAKPNAIRPVCNDDSCSPIIPERTHDRRRLRFTCQLARKGHRQHEMLHLF